MMGYTTRRMAEPTIETFEDFWPYYVRAHRNETNRTIHAVGTLAAFGTVALAVLTAKPSLLLLAPVVGYGPAWFGHFVIEGNRPATFGHALYSLRGDVRMLRLTLSGKMGAEVERCVALKAAEA
jgi:hypothetical protein